jgi:hypothetical protein
MLCRPRTLTPAALAARRANALKSTGRRTDRGKDHVTLNPYVRRESARKARPWVWCAHRSWQDYAGAKLKNPLEPADCEARLTNQCRIATCGTPIAPSEAPASGDGIRRAMLSSQMCDSPHLLSITEQLLSRHALSAGFRFGIIGAHRAPLQRLSR